MKHGIGRRLLSIVLSVMMLVSLLPTTAFAEDSIDNDDEPSLNEVVGSAGSEKGSEENVIPTATNLVTVNGTDYATLAEAIANATPVNGVITYEINGKADISGNDQWISFVKDATNVKKVVFIGKNSDAEISITSSQSILGVQEMDIDVELKDLTLSHPNGAWVADLANATNYFACMVRSAGHTVTYNNCTFPNGVCNNQYGKTVFEGCKFTSTSGWNLWNTSTGTSELNNCTFTGARGVKLYAEGSTSVAGSVTVKNTAFDLNDAEKAAIEITKPGSVELENVSVSGTTAGTIKKNLTDGYSSVEKMTVEATGTGISGSFTGKAEGFTAKDEFNISAGTFTSAVSEDYLADGFTIADDGNGNFGVKEEVTSTAVAKIGETKYDTLDEALEYLVGLEQKDMQPTPEEYALTLLDESAWNTATPVYWAAGTKSGFAAKLTDALTAAYKANAGKITIVCRPGADVGAMTHGHVADNITIFGNKAYVSGGECDLEVDTYKYNRETGANTGDGSDLNGDISIIAFQLDNLGVWGQRHTTHTVNVALVDCDGKDIAGKANPQRVYISGTSGQNMIGVTDCDFKTANTAVYSNADGKVTVCYCTFEGSKAPVNINHKANGTMSVDVQDCTFTNCGDAGDWKQFAAPVRFVNSGNGTMKTGVQRTTFTDTVGTNGDILLGDGRTGEKSNDVSMYVSGTDANIQAQKPGYYNGNTTDANKKAATEVKSNETLDTSVETLLPAELTNYATVELTFGSNVSAEDIAAAMAMYKGKQYETCKAANEAYMALFGVTWEKGYLDVTDTNAPLYKYAGVSGSVAEVKYYIHGTMAGFTSLQSSGNQIDCTVGGNHQIFRTSVSIIGVNDANGNKAKLTDGNVQAYVAGGYESMFTASGKLTIDNIEFTTTTSTTVGASAATGTNGSSKKATGEMEIKNCKFNGRLYVYDNFDNTGMTYNIHDNVFDGTHYSGDGNAYAIFAQCKGGNKLIIEKNTISGFARGINIDHANVTATIKGNTISITDKNRSCIQLSSLTKAEITGNTLNLTGGNAFTLHSKLAEGSKIVIDGNTVNGIGYLIYDDTKNSIDLTYTNNNKVASTVDTTKGIYNDTTKNLSSAVNAVINGVANDGSEDNPYTLEQLGAMTRAEYITAQTRLGGTMYVTVGDYSYDTNGVLGNGTADNSDKDSTKMNYYGAPGAKSGQYSDAAVGKSIVFVGGSITSGVTGYTSIDNIGTSLLLAVPAYTNVTFKDITFNNVMSFNYQLYTSPWSQLGELKFDNCTFNGIIVGAIAAQTLTFNGCTFTNYTNQKSANSSNPTWIRPAYGNWTQGDNEGQGSDFKSLTTINFTGNTVTSTRPVKFEFISQWDITSTVTATGNYFDISKQDGDDTVKNVGLYLGTHTDANAFNLVAEDNTKSANTAALYTIPEGKTSLPLGSTVKDTKGNEVELTDALKWKAGDAAEDKIVLKTVEAVASIGDAKYASLAAAIAAAKDGDTVTLLADATEDVVINKNITLDLGGKTLTNTNAGKATISVTGGKVTVKGGSVMGGTSYYNIEVTKGSNANLTLENVTATAGNTGSSMIDNWGTLTITSGTYTGGLNVVKSEEGSKLTITGGTFTLEYATNGYTGVVFAYGDTTISGGEFIQNLTTTGRWNHPTVILTGVVEGYTAITRVTGGHFVNKMSGESIFRGVGKGTSDNFEVSGGTFNKSISDGFCADGFIPTKNADGTYGVKEGKYVAKVGSSNYETLADAIRLAAKGKTITLLADVTENVTIPAGKTITLDLNGCILNGGTGTAKAALTNLGTITITDSSTAKTGTIKRDDNGTVGETSYYVIRNQGTMTIESGTVINNSGYRKTNPTGSMSGSSLICNGDCDEGGTLTIKGGTFTQNNFIAIKNGALGVLHVTGGTITSNHSAIQNWFKADITGGEIKGQLWTDAWKEGESVGETKIGGDAKFTGEIVMDITGSVAPTLAINGGNLDVTSWRITSAAANAGAKPAVSGGTFTSAVPEDYCADGFIPTKNADGTYGVKEGTYVAEVNGTKYESLQAAINAATRKATVTMLADTKENVTISTPYLTLDLNGYTLNGGTEKGKPALTVTARVTVKDSSKLQTGTIMREDTAENSGVSSHYVIDIQGGGWLTFESGTVKNGSGAGGTKGASLVRVGDDSVKKNPGLNIKGGTFTQDNFIVIKVDRGDLFLNGGTLNSANSYAIEDWHRATIKGGTVNGTVAAWTYSGGHNSELTISGGTVNGNVASVSYDKTEGKLAKVSITGGTVIGELGTYTYNDGLVPIEETSMATIEVTGGTFKNDPTKYVVEDSAVKNNTDGTFGVEKAYLAKVGDTSYYTMDEAFHAAVASGETLCLLRDYTTGAVQNSGSNSFTIDLNGKTWTYTGTDTNCAAFEINYPNVTLTVKNGTVVSNSMVGLIPSAMGGTITYDNAGLVFENVKMTANGHSGIETNGNNTNDTVTLKNSTLNVPNGFGIYFPSSGKLTIDNSTINAKTMGVQVCAGSLSINAGSAITVTGGPVPKTENDGAIQDGAAISIVNRTGYKGLDKIEVTGGKFTAKTGNEAIKAYNWANKAESTFTANDKVAVSGGTFSSAVPAGLCATGYVPTEKATDGTYTVAVKEDVVAVIDKTEYTTLNEALMSAQTGETVVLMKDTTADIVMIRAGVTLNLYGHSVTNALLIYDNGQIIDTGDVKGIVQAEGYFMTTNEHTPVYDSTKNGYSFFDLRVGGGTKGNNAYLWLEGSEPDFSSAVALMKADTNGRRIKAVITFIWTDTVSHSEATQSYEFVDEYMSTYLENAASKSFFARVSGLDKFEGTVKAQAKFVITNESGVMLNELVGPEWTVKD